MTVRGCVSSLRRLAVPPREASSRLGLRRFQAFNERHPAAFRFVALLRSKLVSTAIVPFWFAPVFIHVDTAER